MLLDADVRDSVRAVGYPEVIQIGICGSVPTVGLCEVIATARLTGKQEVSCIARRSAQSSSFFIVSAGSIEKNPLEGRGR